ncbi:MAG TPA: hypothetical protein VM118_06785, partial [Acidobacteriota bacterium]|nr:hypothetical protein [Acidobacteriota bacterium]
MKRVTSILAAALILCSGAGAWAANSVVVQSATLGTNGNNCEIRVRIENDVALNALQIPLVIREVTPGAFITEMELVFDDRLGPGGRLDDIQIRQHHAEPDGSCKPGGFGVATYTDGLPHPVAASPEGAVFAAVAIMPSNYLPPGTDVTGSLVLTVDLTGIPGTFEIDTTCADPNIHVLFSDEYGYWMIPSFTKGIITVVPNAPPVVLCSDVTVAADAFCEATASIDNGSYDPDGNPMTIVQTPPGPYPLGDTDVWLIVSDPY